MEPGTPIGSESDQLENMSIADLQNKLLGMRSYLAQLKSEIAKKSVGQIISATPAHDAEGQGFTVLTPELIQQISTSTTSNAKRRKMSEAHVAYRLAGHTIFPVESNRTGIRFETFYDGEYFEQYYVILEFVQGTVSIYRHSLPPFIPLAKFRHLVNENLKQFLNDVTLYLNAYVNRRQQMVDAIKTKNENFVETPQASQVVDYIKFIYQPAPESLHHAANIPKFIVNVIYEDLLKTLPTRVIIYREAAQGRKIRARHLESHFMKEKILDACKLAFDAYARDEGEEEEQQEAEE